VTVYSGVVFLHVVSAIVVVGSTFFSPLVGAGLRRASSTRSLQEWARLFQAMGQWAGKAAAVVLLTGLYLAFDGDWWGSGWLEVSLVLFTLAGVGAMGVLDPWAGRLVEAAEAAPDGPVGADLHAMRRDQRIETVEAFFLPLDATIVFLMTNKPGFTGALVAVGVALVVGSALQRIPHRATQEEPLAPA
jgi:hypothetical protein